MNTFHNNPEKSSITKINKHTASGYSLFTHCSFDTTKNKLDYYRGKNCMRNFCKERNERKERNDIVNKGGKKFSPYFKKILYIEKKKV